MVKRKERGSRRQILQLHEQRTPTKVENNCVPQIGYSDSSEESDEEEASGCSQDVNNKGKDVIDEQVADFLKEIDAIAVPAEGSTDSAEPKEVPVVTDASAASVDVEASDQSRETNGDTVYSQDDELRCAWQQCQDESTGYAYYWNVETNEVTWECPAEYLTYWSRLNAAMVSKSVEQREAVMAEAVTCNARSPILTEQAKNESFEGKIIPITSYGSSSDEMSDEAAVTPARQTSRSKKRARLRAAANSSQCEYGPQLPPAGLQSSSPTLGSPVVQGCEPPPLDVVTCDEDRGEEIVYGPQLPSAGDKSCAVDISVLHGPRHEVEATEDAGSHQLPLMSTYEPLGDSPSSEANGDDVPSATSASVEPLSQEGEGVRAAPLIDYPNSPINEDEEDCAEQLTTSASSTAVNYPVMTSTSMEFGPPCTEPAGGLEPDSTTQAASDAAPLSCAQASLLVSYGESESEEDDASADTSEPGASSGCDTGSACPAETEKYLLGDTTSTASPGSHRGFGFSEFGDSVSSAKILARKKRLMAVKFVKSDEVLYLSEATAAGDAEEVQETKVLEASSVKEEDSDDDFDVLQALDDALMESKKKAAKGAESNKETSEGSRQENVDLEPVTREPSDGSSVSQQDMMIDSPAEAVIKIGDYSDEIETSITVVMAKLTHFSTVGKPDDSTIRDLAVQVQTRVMDWRAGALDPRYCWTKLQEVHDMLQLREASMSLPSGWSCHWDSGTMRYFYMHEATGRSQWESPSDLPEEEIAFGPQQLPAVTSSTTEVSTVSPSASVNESGWIATAESPPGSRGEKRKAELCVEENQLPSGDVADCDDTATEAVTDTQPPEQVDDEQQPGKCADESAASTSKRKKTKLSAGLALRKKNIPSLLQKWEKIKKQQQRENLK